MMERCNTERKYFAASNSSSGFVNYYGECFGADAGVERLYVIKGGPGTGKSRFMRDVAEAAQVRGYEVDYYYCSSDAASLDGVRLTWKGEHTRRIGIVDGTPPHAWEPSLPGVREELVNLGDFWDSRGLRGESVRVGHLNRLKKQCYQMAYQYLRGCGETARVQESLLAPCVLHTKIDALARRILRSLPKGSGFYAEPALQNGVGMTGCTHFDTFEREATVLYRMDSYYGVEYHVTEALLRLSRERQLSVRVSWDPVCPWRVDGLFWPDGGLAVVIAPDGDAMPHHRRIYLNHYADRELLGGLRQELRFARGAEKRLLEGACNCLDRAAGYHFELEEIYASAMDFDKKEAFTKRFCDTVLGG